MLVIGIFHDRPRTPSMHGADNSVFGKISNTMGRGLLTGSRESKAFEIRGLSVLVLSCAAYLPISDRPTYFYCAFHKVVFEGDSLSNDFTFSMSLHRHSIEHRYY